MLEMPLYQYTMEILIDEECCLIGQPLWYKGASNGWTWTSRVAHQMSDTYRGR